MAVLVNFSILPKRKKRTYLFMIWILHHLPPSLWVEKSKATRSLGNWRLWLQVVFMAEKNLGEQIGPWSLFHRFSPTKSSRNKEAFFCRASLKNNNESSRCYVRVFRLLWSVAPSFLDAEFATFAHKPFTGGVNRCWQVLLQITPGTSLVGGWTTHVKNMKKVKLDHFPR